MRTNRGAFGVGVALGMLLTTSMAWAGRNASRPAPTAFGTSAVCVGIVGVAYAVFQRAKARRVLDAPLARTGDVARGLGRVSPNGQVSVEGAVVCVRALVAPVTGVPCLYYRVTRTAKWNDGGVVRSKVVDQQVMAAHFAIDDGSGAVWIDARQGGDFEPMLRQRQTKTGGILGATYELDEEILPLVPRLYACGRAPERGGAIEPTSTGPLILSSKTRDELIGGPLARVANRELGMVTTRRSF